MKKIIILGACIAIGSIQQSEAQHKNKVAPPPPPMAYLAPPPPPAPPVPPPPPAPEALALPPAPPPAPPAPPAPKRQSNQLSNENYVEIVNSNGYEISVRKVKAVATVFVEKDGKTQRIKLSTWNANRKFYEKKYGQLPPPPPPPPLEQVMLSTPVIEPEK